MGLFIVFCIFVLFFCAVFFFLLLKLVFDACKFDLEAFQADIEAEKIRRYRLKLQIFEKKLIAPVSYRVREKIIF